MFLIWNILSFFFNKYTFGVALLLLVLKLYLKFTTGYCRSDATIHGKTVLITGANTGIGKETAKDLARRGGRIILACRDLEKAKKARDEIIASTKNENIIIKKLDLLSLSSVREFAADIKASEERLDILINNAGVGAMPQRHTVDNLLPTMQVNYFSTFLLTLLLIDLLKKSAPSRIIMVSSVAHKYAKLDLNTINVRKACGSQRLYNNSKLCLMLFSNELARKLSKTGVTVNSVHPGAVLTDIFKAIPKFYYRIFLVIAKAYFKTPYEGAQTLVHLAVTPGLEKITGKYFVDCAEDKPLPLATDEGMAKKLWEITEQFVGLKPEEKFW
ncbi:retinol dehydrogenase 14-like [Schistocerca nitens]|uniref:retinol dehydrogenase 14-like n=1 Tax=Schistocerca nitens TaxID=7011 RepID=UPI002117ADAC|nr:retinol dehydrogenase 14-like [Schistocerca nitens]